MKVFLEGLSLRNYRGIGPEWQTCPQFGGMNFFVGPNNAGKSGILRYISNHIGRFGSDGWNNVATDDQYNRGTTGATEVKLPEQISKILQSISISDNSQPVAAQQQLQRNRITLQHMLAVVYGAKCSSVWHQFVSGSPQPTLSPPFDFPVSPPFNFPPQTDQAFVNDIQNLWMALTHLGGGGNLESWTAKIREFISSPNRLSFPECRIIPAIRQIGATNEPFRDYSGTGLIDKLKEVQDPDYDAQGDKVIFQRINAFLQMVTGEPKAQINIPHNRRHVMVETSDRVLPLAYLGTGIHEVIMIAAFCTLSENSIICLEEPEIHLHPILQRKLITYLLEKTNNQYFIATHSHCFIDTEGACLYEITYQNQQTKVKAALAKADRHSICQTLGYRASDIVQANTVVWVEGPTDRLYINYWLGKFDPTLREGIDYSVMFYGGRLLNHLSASDDEISEFISLRNLNRNFVIVIDSDKDSEDAKINETKLRLCSEIQDGGIAWVTKGREIENYIPPQQIATALAAVYPNFDRQVSESQFDHALIYIDTFGNQHHNADKIKIARAIIKAEHPDLSCLDLYERIQELAVFINLCSQ